MDNDTQAEECSGGGNSPIPLLSTSENYTEQSSDLFEDIDDGQLTEENVIAQFHAQMSNVLSDAKVKMLEEAQKFNSAAYNQTKSTLAQMKLRHTAEKTDMLQKMKRLKVFCDSLETSVNAKDELIKSLIGKLDYQQNCLLTSKVFNAWRRHTVMNKHRAHLLVIAEKHYEQNLKKEMFHHWRDLLKRTWKQHVELRANVEILEAQKQVVSLYENKIRNLEDSLSEAGKKIDKLLEFKQRPLQEELPRVVPTRCTEQLNNNNVNFHSKEVNMRSENLRAVYQRPDTNTAALCSECSTKAYTGVSERYFMYSAAPPVNYVLSQDEAITEIMPQPKSYHPSSQQQSIPVMGTVNTRPSSGKRNGDVPKTSRSQILVERHFPRNQTLGGNSSTSVRLQSSRTQSHKKIV